MEFSIEKCTMPIMKSKKKKKSSNTDRMELPNQHKIRKFGEKKPTNTWGYWKITPSNKSR